MKKFNVKKTAYLGLFTVLALIFSYIEVLLPFNFGIPGVKIGLANIVTLAVLYLYGFKEGLAVLICRILLAGILFGNMYSILYSLAGGILSIIFMYIVKKIPYFSIIAVSITGGVTHNLGQLIVAALVISQIRIVMYGPVLLISGLITGLVIGIICKNALNIIESHIPELTDTTDFEKILSNKK